MKDNLGMEIDHTETFLDCPSDDKKVKDVVKTFDATRIRVDMNSFLRKHEAEKQKRIENRKVKDVGGLFGLGTKPDVVTWSSYDDHLDLLEKEIEDQKAEIIKGLERLDLLIQKEVLVREERDSVTEKDFQLPEYLKVNEKFDPLIKEHIFHKHQKLIGDYYGEYKYSSHAGNIRMETVYNKEGEVVKVRCWDCLMEFYKANGFTSDVSPTKDDGEIDTYDKVGGK